MKKIHFAFFTALIMLLGACSEDEVADVTPKITQTYDTLYYSDFVTPEMEFIAPRMLPFMAPQHQRILGKNASDIMQMLNAPNARTEAQQQEILGPFTRNATLTKIVSDGGFILSGWPGLATGLYFCDVYNSSTFITLPSGQFPILLGASIMGYSDFVNRVEGIVTSTVGQTTSYITRSVIVKSNALGQQLGYGPYPRDLRGNVYTYSVFVP